MNKIIAIIICMFGIQTMNAQTTLSIGFLKSNKWMILEDGVEEGKKDTTFVSFDNKKMYTSTHYHFFHPIKKKVIDRTLKCEEAYYLSNTLHNSYDAAKVGKATTGKYITFHSLTARDVDPNDFQTYEITRESDSEIVLTLRNFSHNYLDLIGFQPDGEMILKKKQLICILEFLIEKILMKIYTNKRLLM